MQILYTASMGLVLLLNKLFRILNNNILICHIFPKKIDKALALVVSISITFILFCPRVLICLALMANNRIIWYD